MYGFGWLREKLGSRQIIYLSFASGVAVGVLFTCLLSLEANNIYKRKLHASYQFEQRVLAAKAWQINDERAAERYYANILETYEFPGLETFDPANRDWDFFYPLTAFLFRSTFSEPADSDSEKGHQRILGTLHLMHAIALEKDRNRNMAQHEIDIAKNLLGIESEEQIKELGINLINSEQDLLGSKGK